MVARYKKWQLVVVGWNARRKALGFFGHVTWQASGLREGSKAELGIQDEFLVATKFYFDKTRLSNRLKNA
jgi:hypothetical protein